MKKYIGLIIGLLPLLSSAQLVINSGGYVVINGSAASPSGMVLTNAATTAITNASTGWIITNNDYSFVQWNIGTGTGIYRVPFGYSTTDYLLLTFQVTAAGVGNGVVKFSSYHGSNWDNAAYEPSDVTTLSDFGAGDYSVNMVDRFWNIDANSGYTTKPTVNMKFSYINSGAGAEVSAPNYIVNNALIAQRFNSSSDVWDDFLGSTGTQLTSGNVATVSSGSVSPADLFRSWTVANDSNLITNVGVVSVASSNLTIWPSPATQCINVKFGAGLSGDAVISVVNVIGQELIRKSQYISTGMILPIDISTLPAAMYFIRVNTDKTETATKFIKQ